MINILGQLLSKAIDMGVDVVTSNKQFKQLKQVVIEKTARELRFNSELLGERIPKSDLADEKVIDILIGSLSTDSFDELIKSSVPLIIIFDEYILDANDWLAYQKTLKKESRQMLGWAKGIKSQAELIERIYHRTKIIKLFCTMNMRKGLVSIQYIKFLILAFQHFEKNKKSV